MHRILFSILAASLPAHAYPVDALSTYSVNIDANYRLDLTPVLGEAPLTPDVLESKLGVSTTYETFLHDLRAAFPDLFGAPVFLHSTGSLQRADLAHPRVLAYGRGAVLAFGGLDRAPHVEMIHYDAGTNSYRATEITFPNGAPRFDRDPKACVACHGSPLKPLWEPYDLWPKAYGTFSGFFEGGAGKKEFADFLKSRMQLGGIYREVAEPPPGYSEGDDSDLVGPTAFTQFLSSVHFIRTMRELGARKELVPYRYALTAAFAGCMLPPGADGVSSRRWDPSEFLNGALPAPYSFFTADVAAGKQAQQNYVQRLFGALFPGKKLDMSNEGRLFFENGVYASVRYLLENNGVRWADLAITDGGTSYSMNVPTNLPFELGVLTPLIAPGVVEELQPKLIEIGGMFAKRIQFDCAKLAERSKAALAGVRPPPPVAKTSFSDPVGLSPMNRCVRCHLAGLSTVRPPAPYVPFENAMKLREWLRAPGNLVKLRVLVNNGAMPKDGALSPEEKSALLEALDRLATE